MRPEGYHVRLAKQIGKKNARYLDVPRSLAETVEPKFVGNLSSIHRVGQILLVGKDKQERITELILVEHALQLLTCLGDTLAIVGVDHENDTLGILEVCIELVIKGLFRRCEQTYNASREDGSCPVLRRPRR